MPTLKKIEVSCLIGNRVRSLRHKIGYTMEELAFEVGIEYTQLSRIERGKINTSIYQLFLLSRALKVPFSEIIEGLDNVGFQVD